MGCVVEGIILLHDRLQYDNQLHCPEHCCTNSMFYVSTTPRRLLDLGTPSGFLNNTVQV